MSDAGLLSACEKHERGLRPESLLSQAVSQRHQKRAQGIHLTLGIMMSSKDARGTVSNRVSRDFSLIYHAFIFNKNVGGTSIVKINKRKTSPPAQGWWGPYALTSLASMTVPTPTVKAMVGTLVSSPSKNLALARMVSMASVFTRVLDTRLEPGSLKAMCPSGPMPTGREPVQPCQSQGSKISRMDNLSFPN